MMSDATKAMATDTGILTRDIAELVAGALQASGVDSRQGAGVGGG
jgi:hypothetical protein